ncbi:ketopantoate reductase family protein [uncultured Jatrophihabitans sp.]|uniref:ketopantoate reductase family protein n=1 Tax=uncultured Jatrophihabitans sp. TaxID=1610747 RepID=UPI0035C9D19F
MSQPRYVVIGGGAVGGVVAAQLALHGHVVVLIARGEHGKRIAADGLVVRRPATVDVVPLDVAGGPSDVRLRGDDVLVLAVKTQDAESAIAEWAWQPVFDEEGNEVGSAADLPILTLQNGCATEDLALRRFRHVYAATAGIAASFLSPGEIVSPSVNPVGIFWIGRYPGGRADLQRDELLEQIVADFGRSDLGGISVTNIRATKAAKLLINLQYNGVDLLDGSPEDKARAKAAIRDEAAAVLAAAGVPLPPGGQLDYHGHTLDIQPVEGQDRRGSSTWQSFERGVSNEVDFLHGEIVLLARKHDVAAPYNERLQHLLNARHLESQRSVSALLRATVDDSAA